MKDRPEGNGRPRGPVQGHPEGPPITNGAPSGWSSTSRRWRPLPGRTSCDSPTPNRSCGSTRWATTTAVRGARHRAVAWARSSRATRLSPEHMSARWPADVWADDRPGPPTRCVVTSRLRSRRERHPAPRGAVRASRSHEHLLPRLVNKAIRSSLLQARGDDLTALSATAARIRDAGLEAAGRPEVITYSRKVFIPLTRLCRDTCHYCTFVTVPGRLRRDG